MITIVDLNLRLRCSKKHNTCNSCEGRSSATKEIQTLSVSRQDKFICQISNHDQYLDCKINSGKLNFTNKGQ